MGDAILVQQVTSGGEPTISSWAYSTISRGKPLNIGIHDLVIGMVGGGSTTSAWFVAPFLIWLDESPTICTGNTGLYVSAGSYSLTVSYAQNQFPASSMWYSTAGSLGISQNLTYGFVFYVTIDF